MWSPSCILFSFVLQTFFFCFILQTFENIKTVLSLRAVKKRQRARSGPRVSLRTPSVDRSKTAVQGSENTRPRAGDQGRARTCSCETDGGLGPDAQHGVRAPTPHRTARGAGDLAAWRATERSQRSAYAGASSPQNSTAKSHLSCPLAFTAGRTNGW